MATLTQEAIDYLRQAGTDRSYSDGATIVHRGAPGEAFYVVVSGAVEVVLEAEDGRRLPLARLSEGGSFGEMSLLTDEPVSADVLAKGEVTVLACPAGRFRAALAECAPLRDHILARLCDNLRQTNAGAWGHFQRAEALRSLMRDEGRAGPIIAESAAMRKAAAQIAELNPDDAAVLVTGEPGAGKFFAAGQALRQTDGDGTVPVVVDCSLLGETEARKVLFGTTEDRSFARPEPGSDQLRLFGALDLADGGALVLRHVDALDRSSQELLGRYLEARADPDSAVSPRVRVIATTSNDLAALAAADAFDAALAGQLTATTLAMPRMLDRRRDILPLAKLFLAEHDQRDGDVTHHFDTSAEHTLVSAQYRYHNAAELREAVESAALFAEEGEIGSEHIFTGPKDEGGTIEYDLAGAGLVGWLVERSGLTVLRAVLLAVFLAIAVTCLTFSDTIAGRVANGMVWGLWWPVLIILFVLVGRAWCAVCPLSSTGQVIRRLGCLGLKQPEWLKKCSIWLAPLMFLAIVWVEHIFDMTRQPLATGILLLVLMGAATVFCLLFQRELWCRHLCPLGALGAGYANGAMVHVRANPNVCATQCKTHECYKGGEAARGCPVFHHPMYARDGHHCKLCLSCLRGCPHGSARLYVRPPLQGIWRVGNFGEATVPFVSVVPFLILVMLASHGAGWAESPWLYTAVLFLAAGIGVAFYGALRRLLGGQRGVDPAAALPVMLTLLALAAGPLIAFHLENIPGLDMLRVQASSGTGQPAGGGIALLMVLQFGAVSLSAVLAALALWRIRVRLADCDPELPRWRWRVVLGMSAAYLIVAAGLTVLRWTHP